MEVREITDERGRRVAAKRADGPDEAARLRREADLLEVAAHPGLVELVGLGDGAEVELRTVWVGGPSLAAADPLDVEEVAGVVAATASTLADLHAVGLVHGAVEPSHVVLDEDGRPVLCGLGSGGLAGEQGGAGAGVLDPSADVAGLGAVLRFLLARASGRVRGAGADALRQLASRSSGPASDRPSARELADAVHDAVPAARLPRRGATAAAAPDGPAPSEAARPAASGHRVLEGLRRPPLARPPAARRHRRRAVRLAGAGLAAAAGVGAAGLTLAGGVGSGVPGAAPTGAIAPPGAVGPGGPAEADVADVPPSALPPAAAGEPLPSPPVRPAVPAGCPPVDGPLTADVDGDGCAEAVTFSGGVLEAAGRRWAVGQEGDVVAVGDWTCGGRRSLAVLRPSTGEVFAFTAWASAGQDVQAPLVGRVAGGHALRAADFDGDGCNELVVERAGGAPALLHPRRGPG